MCWIWPAIQPTLWKRQPSRQFHPTAIHLMNENPYEAPQSFDAPPSQLSDAEAVRREHLKTEASIKSVGILYFLGGCALLLASFASFGAFGKTEGIEDLSRQATVGVLFAFAIAQFIVGSAVRKLKPWSRIGIGILSGIGLLGFPVGTLINAYILFLTFGKKGQMVFSEPYKEIIAATPHVKYKTSKTVWIILAVVVAIILIGIVSLAFSR